MSVEKEKIKISLLWWIRFSEIAVKVQNAGNTSISMYVFVPIQADDSLTGGAEEEIGGEEKSTSPLREQDRFLPIANVSRIMKNAIPRSGKVHVKKVKSSMMFD